MKLPAAADVVVLGGGTAGAAASRLLASWGHSVLMLEREVTRPPLAESLPPSCIPLLEQIGVREAIDAAGFVRGSGNTVWWGGDPMRVENFPLDRLGFQVPRARLEDVLCDCADKAGAMRVRPATAVRVQRDGDERIVEISLPDGSQTVRTRWVLDCTGRAGLIARAHRVASPDGVRTIALIGVWERDDGWPLPDGSHTLVESAEWGWGWSVPLSETQRCFTAMVDPGTIPLSGPDALLTQYDGLFESLPALGPLLHEARRLGTTWACEATPYHSSEVAWPGLLLVGDAASMIDPLSSYGVKKALASAWLAAVVVHTAFVTPAHLEAALALYRDREAAYVESAARALGGVSRDAAAGSQIPFWSSRSDHAPLDTGGETDHIARLRTDPEVLAAFQALRARPTVRIADPSLVRRELRPVVRGNVVTREEHLVLDGLPESVRYLRSIDLLALLDVASRHGDVGEMYTHYTRRSGPAPLPDFLGALSVLAAKGGTGFV